MHEAFGLTVEQYVYFGGYPGPAPLIGDRDRWARFVLDALIEPTIARDVLLLTRVDKPALLRQLFHLATAHSGQVVSYQKMVGQLQDAGNTTTLAHYLELLSSAGMVTGLAKYSASMIRQRASSPKLQVLNTALISAQTPVSFEAARQNGAHWGRLVESAVGAHLLNSSRGTLIELGYWRERGQEVDFVLSHGEYVVAIEVKSGRPREARSGLSTFANRFGANRMLQVGAGGIPLAEFLASPAGAWTA
jgi:predicted AAA+ superfamily ATPase